MLHLKCNYSLSSCSFLSFQFKIGLCQLSVTSDKDKNIAHARIAIQDAAAKGAKLVLLPVSFVFFFF